MATKTIFMIHGMWGGKWLWDNYVEFFERKGYKCIPTTLRYHDVEPHQKPNPELGTTGLTDYVSDLEKEISELDEKPIIMGHSMGGLLAQILGSKGMGEALVLLTPAAPAGIWVIKPSVLKSFWSVQTKWGFWKKPMRQTFKEAAYSMLNLFPPEEQKKVYSKFVYESGKATVQIGYWFLDSNRSSEVDESKITCPVLVVSGGKDRITPASVVRKVAEKYKSVSTYKEFENHAHWVIGEPGWEEIANYVADWLKQL